MTIREKAAKAAGRVHCTKCKFWKNGFCTDPKVPEVCFENFVKFYLKGYEQAKKDLKQ